MTSRKKVAVFWDYEASNRSLFRFRIILIVDGQNCHPPSNASGYDVVSSIRDQLQSFGDIDSLKAYLQVQDILPKSMNLRSELQSSGVTLIDCPHNGQKDVVDKMLIGKVIVFRTSFAQTLQSTAYSTP
jgi:hypothetical protein